MDITIKKELIDELLVKDDEHTIRRKISDYVLVQHQLISKNGGQIEPQVMLPPNTFLNADCMDYLPKCPAGYFDLAIIDPPYGIGEHGGKLRVNPARPCYELRKTTPKYEDKGWDKSPPSVEYWRELFRVSKNQVIFGANYFVEYLKPSMGWIFWDKKFEGTDFSDGEFIYTSFERGAKKITISSKAETQGGLLRVHPTQKPIYLYRQILEFTKLTSGVVLDTHVGSGSSLIACKEMGFGYVGFEIDKDYYEAASKRVARAFRKYELNFEQNEAAT